MANKYSSWEEFPREDLNMIPKMEAAGWETVFSWSDQQAKRTEPQNCPHDGVSFKRGNVVVWETGYEPSKWGLKSGWTYWMVADIIDNHSRNHRAYQTLENVLEHEKG